MEGENVKTSTEKGCHTQSEKDWKLRRLQLGKTCVQL